MATDLPPPRDEADQKVLDDIERFGWHCVLVANAAHPEHAAENAALPPDSVYDATFAYTVGLTHSYRHPELILVGQWQHAHPIISAAVALVRNERRALAAGDLTGEVLDDYEVSIGEVSDESRLRYLTWADWAYRGEPFEALQVVLPDLSGRWPDDAGYEAWPQPLLA